MMSILFPLASLLAQTPGLTCIDPLPPAFVENLGQWHGDVRFVVRRPELVARFDPTGITLQLLAKRTKERVQGAVVRLQFEGARREASIVGQEPLDARLGFLLGDEPATWRTGVAAYRRILYRGLHSGTDLCVREHDGILEYDVLLEPGADLRAIVVSCDGVAGLRLGPDGSLLLRTVHGELRLRAPVAWQTTPSGERRAVPCSYRILDGMRYGFATPELDPRLALVVDPGIEWSTFLGGSGLDVVTAMAQDATGAVMLAGETASGAFPTTPGAFDTSANGQGDAFVSRLSADGRTLLWSTFLGGSRGDGVTGIGMDGSGVVTVTGFTESPNFPTTPGAWSRTQRGRDCFVTRLAAGGSSLVWSTLLGGGDYDTPAAVAVGAGGEATVVGWTKSTDFPTTPGAYDTTPNGGGDAFVTRLDATGGALAFSTFFGGSGWEPPAAVAVAADGRIYVTGEDYGINGASDFPTTPGAWRTSYAGGKSDAYVVALAGNGSALLHATFLGGDNWDPARAFAVNAAGVTVLGLTYSTDFPRTPGTYASPGSGLGDTYVARLDANLSALSLGCVFGGSDYDDATDLRVDHSGVITGAGWTKSADFPTTAGAYQSMNKGKGDGFVFRLDSAGSRLFYATLVGGADWDAIQRLGVGGDGAAVVGGQVWSSDYPTSQGAFDQSFNGGGDGFATRLDLLPTGVARFGASTPSCLGSIAIGVTRMPVAGDPLFAMTCTQAPPLSPGVLLLGAGALPGGLPVLGVVLHVDPLLPLFAFVTISDPLGAAETPLPLPPDVRGVRVFQQYVWINSAVCGGAGTLSASNALDVTVQ